jgi:hypothetical protein
MKTLFTAFVMFISFSCFSQNYVVNTDNNPPENNNPIALNTGNQINVQAYNQNKQQQPAIPQMQSRSQANDLQIVINAPSRTQTGSTGVSFSTGKSHTKAGIHKRKHGSVDLFEKLFDKKFKKVHHYKKISRIKKCAAF